MHKSLAVLSLALLTLSGCANHSLSHGRAFQVQKVSYTALNGWKTDNMREALPAMLRSCQKPTAEWKNFCQGLQAYKYASSDKIREYMEKTLTPYRAVSYGSNSGTITGYYEAELTGTRTRTKASQVPIYAAPAGYRQGDTLETRKEIEATPNYAPVVAWADDPVDKFILQIQGSGRMTTPSGEEIKLGYAGNNGQPFKGISGIMQEAGALPKGGGSMPQVRTWLKAHPAEAKKFMAENPRYIFFKENKGESPYGSAGVVLTPKRSVAVDRDYIPMNTPMWLETKDPDGAKLNRVVVAQDVGGAIKGGIRADFFWGHGETAFNKAGRMKSAGQYFLLLPN